MRMSWKLGRVSGIDVFLHPTFLFVPLFALGQGEPAFGVALVLAAFGCVFLHELGHAFMARRFGIGTVDITIYPIGGVARLTRMPRSPGAELLIALAGPAVNLAIVAGLGGVRTLGVFGADTVAGTFVWSLLAVNGILALFNLIPAFPMDGGRVLRALLTGWIGRVRATTVAAEIGKVLALAFGTYSLFHGQLFHVALAAFIYMAAVAERASVVAEDRRGSGGDGDGDGGVWTAPPGHRWVPRGGGAWQLAPIVVRGSNRGFPRWR